MDTIDIGKRVLQIEANALLGLAESLGHSFSEATRVIRERAGRLVVTGMGKSGHVARKIAATMSSTGTPATYIHPAEASHGDLGMLGPGDVVVAISNSGETTELRDILHYCRRNDLAVIAITKNPQSTLGRSASVILELANIHEACPLGLAPTTSTTASLAIGDALAVAIYETNGFSALDFGLYHPGGKLGIRLITVQQIMHTDEFIPLVDTATPLGDAIIEISHKAKGCVGVLDQQGDLVGIITDGDLRRHIYDLPLDAPVDSIMTPEPKTIAPAAFAVDALRLMNNEAITSLFVLDGRKPIGVLHIHDCLRAGIDQSMLGGGE